MLSLVVTLKNETTGKLTRAGKIYAGLIILGGILVIVAQAADGWKQEADTRTQVAKANKLLEQVVRAQYPLQNVRLSTYLFLSPQHASVQRYESRLLGDIQKLDPGPVDRLPPPPKQLRTWLAVNNRLYSVSIGSESPLFPESTSPEVDVHDMVARAGVRLLFYRKPVPVARAPLFVWMGANTVDPDLEMQFETKDPWIDYRPSERKIRVLSIGLSTRPEEWRGSGQIISVVDLPGSQVIIDLHPRHSDESRFVTPTLETVELYIGTLGALWLHGNQLKPHTLPNGDIVYEFIFPKTLEQVLQLQRRS